MIRQLVLLSLLCFFPLGAISTSSQNIQDPQVLSITNQIELRLNQSSLYTSEMQIIFPSNLTQYSITINQVVNNISVFLDGMATASHTSWLQDRTTIEFSPTNLKAGQRQHLMISAEFQPKITQTSAETYHFIYDWDTSWICGNITIIVLLPLQTILTQQDEQAIFPNTYQHSGNGQQQMLIWSPLSNNGDFTTLIFFSFSSNRSAAVTHTTSSPFNWLVYILLGLLLLAVGLLSYVLLVYLPTIQQAQHPENNTETRIVTTIRPVLLSPQELEILKIISEFDGGIQQSELVSALNFSRARISQYLSKFEEQGLITKYKMGRQNYITLAQGIEFEED